MKGKIFKYDKATDKMVLVSGATMEPIGEIEIADGVKLGVGILGVPAEVQVPQFSDRERENMRQVLRKADEYAEGMSRRDCNRVQEKVAEMRERFGIDE